MTEMKILKNSVLLIRFLLKHIYRKEKKKRWRYQHDLNILISIFLLLLWIFIFFIVYIPMCLGNRVY